MAEALPDGLGTFQQAKWSASEWSEGGVRVQRRRPIGIQGEAGDTASAANRTVRPPGTASRNSGKAGEHFSRRERDAPAKDHPQGISLLLPDRRVQCLQFALSFVSYGI